MLDVDVDMDLEKVERETKTEKIEEWFSSCLRNQPGASLSR